MSDCPAGRALLAVTPAFFVDLLKAGGLPRRFEVIAHGLPDDAELVRLHFDGSHILLEVSSAAFPVPIAGVPLPRLPEPQGRILSSDAQIVHDACKLRAALLTEFKTWTGALPPHLVELLATTQRYHIPELALKGS